MAGVDIGTGNTMDQTKLENWMSPKSAGRKGINLLEIEEESTITKSEEGNKHGIL